MLFTSVKNKLTWLTLLNNKVNFVNYSSHVYTWSSLNLSKNGMCIARVFPSFSSIANESFSGFTPSAIKEIKTKLMEM